MSSETDRSSLTRFAWLSISAAVVTIGLKVVAYRLTGSVGLLSDAIESLVNLVGGVTALAMLTVAARPADEDHPYGHSKAEYFSSGVEGALILLAAVSIGYAAVSRLITPSPLQQVGLGLVVSVLASLVNLVVALLLLRVGRRRNSITLEANAQHLLTDVWTSAGVLVGVAAVALTGWQRLDPIVALAVAANIIWTGVGIVRRSAAGLMDSALTAQDLAAVQRVLATHQDAGLQFHKLQTRQAGARKFISVHVHVPGDWTVDRGHQAAGRVASDIRQALPEADVATHLEPLAVPQPPPLQPAARKAPYLAIVGGALFVACSPSLGSQPALPKARSQQHSPAPASKASNQMRHLMVLDVPGVFAGWPANNGLWSWDGGREILVGCTLGKYTEQPGHNIAPPYRSVLLRSTDAGESWVMEDPPNFVGDVSRPIALPAGIDFAHPALAIRCVGFGYHGSDDRIASFFVSTNRGRAWSGPFRFNGLNETPEQKGRDQTPRTDYLPLGATSCLFFMASRPAGESSLLDRAYVARTDDGGATFTFVGWMVPPSDPFRAVMPSTVRVGGGHLVSALRRRTDDDRCWVDAFSSSDSGKSWQRRSEVGPTGGGNGNPPALVRLKDGRLCCVYGNRTSRQMNARFSDNLAQTWGKEVVLRADFTEKDADFGYPRVVQRPDGKLVALYYFATARNPRQHIAATIFEGNPQD